MTTSSNWDQARNVLAVRLDALGDVLMTTPALRALKESCPGRRLTLFTSPAGEWAARLIPEVDRVLVYEAPWMKATAPRADSRPEFAMLEELRRRRFDGAVIFTVYSQNPLPAAFLYQLADIPRRLAHCRENPYQLLTDWVPDPEPDRCLRHEVRRQLDLVGAVGCRTADERLSLRVPDTARRRVATALEGLGIGPDSRWVLGGFGAVAALPAGGVCGGGSATGVRTRLRSGVHRRGAGARIGRTGSGLDGGAVAFAGWSARPGGVCRLGGAGAAADRQQQRAGACRRGGRDAGRGPVRPDEPAAHALGRAAPRPEP